MKKKKNRYKLSSPLLLPPLPATQPTVDLPCTQTPGFKDGLKEGMRPPGFHQPLEEECGEHFPRRRR